MARTIRRFIDAQVTEIHIVFGVGGVGLEVKYVEQETDEAGTVVRQEPEAKETIAPEDLTPADRNAIERISRSLADNFRARKYR